ncbi:energy transducer TonB [Sphingomonas profundi]|uniref:energy transducer TonB n=1 Tax=Alterirhizorhabdus profundi TaxID=2681549 RepID=UPI0018D08630|nr:energy transducer TonB [Sphingomonas profundi]
MRWIRSVGGVLLLMIASPALAQLVSVQLDYPPAELKAGIEGVVGFEVKVAKSGKVVGCRITETSGNVNLDRQTCVQLTRTGQFKPAVDAAGNPVQSTYARKLRWIIPRPAPDVAAVAAPR